MAVGSGGVSSAQPTPIRYAGVRYLGRVGDPGVSDLPSVVVKLSPSSRTILILILSGLTVAAFLIALGTFDVYVAIVAQVLLLATVVCGVLALVGNRRSRQPLH